MPNIHTVIKVVSFVLGLPSLIMAALAIADSVQKGQMLHEHGLITEAKKEYINVIFSWQSNREDKAEAYYGLGVIALDEKNPNRAVRTWLELIKKYPESEHADRARNSIKNLSKNFDGANGNENKTDTNPTDETDVNSSVFPIYSDAQVEVISVTHGKRLTGGKRRSVSYTSVTVKNVGNKTAHQVTCRAYNEKGEQVGFTFLARLKDIPPGKSASNDMMFHDPAYHKQSKTFEYRASGAVLRNIR